MISRRQEIVLGLFVLIGLAVLITLIIFFRDVVRVGRARYAITAKFDNVYGMSPGTPVRLLGIDIGEIKRVSLTEDGLKAKVLLSVDARQQIREDSRLRIRPQGILGDYYLEFDGGSASAGFLPIDGSAVVNGESASIMDEMAEDLSRELRGIGKKIGDLVDNMNDIIGNREFRENIRTATANIRSASEEAPQTVVAIRESARQMKDLAADIQSRLDKQGKNFETMTSGLSGTLTAMNEVMASVSDILERFKEGRGTVGSLIGKGELYDKLVKTVDETNATLAEMKELIVLIRNNPSIFLWGR